LDCIEIYLDFNRNYKFSFLRIEEKKLCVFFNWVSESTRLTRQHVVSRVLIFLAR